MKRTQGEIHGRHLSHSLKGRYEQTKMGGKGILSREKAEKRLDHTWSTLLCKLPAFPSQPSCLVIKFVHTFSNSPLWMSAKGALSILFWSCYILDEGKKHGFGARWLMSELFYSLNYWFLAGFDWQFSSSPNVSDTKGSSILKDKWGFPTHQI